MLMILWMEEVLYHLELLNPYKYWDKLAISMTLAISYTRLSSMPADPRSTTRQTRSWKKLVGSPWVREVMT